MTSPQKIFLIILVQLALAAVVFHASLAVYKSAPVLGMILIGAFALQILMTIRSILAFWSVLSECTP